MKLCLAAAFALVLPLALFSQEFRGAISGAVLDPTGASVAGAKVTVTGDNYDHDAESASSGYPSPCDGRSRGTGNGSGCARASVSDQPPALAS